MAKRKSTKKYYFSVEGETERWYLKWLQDRINETEKSIYVVLELPHPEESAEESKSYGNNRKDRNMAFV